MPAPLPLRAGLAAVLALPLLTACTGSGGSAAPGPSRSSSAPAALDAGQRERLGIVPTADGDPSWCGPVAAFAVHSFASGRPDDAAFTSPYRAEQGAVADDAVALAGAPGLPEVLQRYLEDLAANASGATARSDAAPEALFGTFSGQQLQEAVDRDCPGTAAFVSTHAGPTVRLGGQGFAPYSPPPGLPPLDALG